MSKARRQRLFPCTLRFASPSDHNLQDGSCVEHPAVYPVNTHLPHQFNGMVILEDEMRTRYLVLAKNILAYRGRPAWPLL